VDQDAFASESQRRAADAIARGLFADEIIAVDVPQKKGPPTRVTVDEYPRAGTTVETLSRLRPAFTREGSVTAGNASGINDGAAALMVSSAARARDLGAAPMATILSYASNRGRAADHGHGTGRGRTARRSDEPGGRSPTSISSS
jgi:acetyl-CoA C-acetyltransferase